MGTPFLVAQVIHTPHLRQGSPSRFSIASICLRTLETVDLIHAPLRRLTNYDWYVLHTSKAAVEEVNFWRSSRHTQRLHCRRHRIGEEHGVNPLHDVA